MSSDDRPRPRTWRLRLGSQAGATELRELRGHDTELRNYGDMNYGDMIRNAIS